MKFDHVCTTASVKIPAHSRCPVSDVWDYSSVLREVKCISSLGSLVSGSMMEGWPLDCTGTFWRRKILHPRLPRWWTKWCHYIGWHQPASHPSPILPVRLSLYLNLSLWSGFHVTLCPSTQTGSTAFSSWRETEKQNTIHLNNDIFLNLYGSNNQWHSAARHFDVR